MDFLFLLYSKVGENFNAKRREKENGLELIITGESVRIVGFAKCAICWSCSRGATIQTITVLDQFSGTTFPFHASLIIQRIFDKYYWTNFQDWPYIIPRTIARENTFNRKIIEEIQNDDTPRKLFSSSSSFRVIFQKDNRQGGILKEGVAWNEDTTALTWQCKHVHLFLPGGCEGGCGPIKSCLSFSPLPLRPSLNDVPG